MAEQTAIPIPKSMPLPVKVVNDFVHFMFLPHQLLHGLSLRDLLGWNEPADEALDRFALLELDINDMAVQPKVGYPPITNKAWLVGSRIWRPAVLGEVCPPDKDFDIVFADLGASLDFVGKAQKLIHQKIGQNIYTIVDSKLGGHKLKDEKSGLSIIDAIDLPVGQTIAEHIMGYQWDHERVAVALGAGRDDLHALTRIVRPAVFKGQQKQVTAAQKLIKHYDYGS